MEEGTVCYHTIIILHERCVNMLREINYVHRYIVYSGSGKVLEEKGKKKQTFLSLAIALISFWTQQTCDGQVEFLW